MRRYVRTLDSEALTLLKTSFLKILERLGGESRIHYSLDHFTAALAAVGNPEKTVNAIVISGTNGKGTTSLFLSSALVEAGYRVGTYLSPHLQHPQERFLLNLEPVAWETLEAIAQDHAELADRFQLTYFEFLTLVFFLWARQADVKQVVLEVGMGGRLDAVNVTHPIGTVLTQIDWDHQRYLGNTLEAILEEKMGIFRPGVPVFSNLQPEALRTRLEARTRELGSPLGYGWKVPSRMLTCDWDGQTAEIDGMPFFLSNPTPATLENAALAYRCLREVYPNIDTETLQRAFARVKTPGRMEVVQDSPRVVLSGDHNPSGIDCLVATLHRLGTRSHIVCGFSPDKPYRELIGKLREVAASLVLTQIPRLASAMPTDYRDAAPFIADPNEALETALKACAPSDTLVVTGSLYLVGELRSRWKAGVPAE